MDIYELLEKRRSIRKYTKRDVSEELLNKVLQAGLHTSTSGNMQSYSIIVTRDEKMKKKLHKPHFEQSMILEAPVFLTFCADFHRMREWLKASEAPMNFDNFMSFMIAAIDAILVSQTVALAAESEGLGICYMGTTLASCKEISEVLELPDNVVPVVGFSLGYPDDQPGKRIRLPLTSVVHSEVYRNESPQKVREMYKEKERDGNNRIEYPDGVQNLGQYYTKVKYTRESHLKYSQDVLELINLKNFMSLQ